MTRVNRTCDVLVVGGGPAGCAAAISALRAEPSARVVILDRAEFPRDKPCGDGIAGLAVRDLGSLGLDTAAITRGYPPMNRFRVISPHGVEVARTMREPVWVIPRHVLDARLLDQVRAAGVELCRHTVRRVVASDDHVDVDDAWRARVVIGADGAESAVRRATGERSNPPTAMAVAIRGYGPELPHQDGAQLIRMTTHQWPAYAWSFPIGSGAANLGYGQLVDASRPTRAGLLEHLSALLPGAQVHPETLRAYRLPMSTHRPPIRPGRVLLAGDALSMINPLSGEGIYYAVVTGALAGRAAHSDGAAGEVYRHLVRRRLGRYLRHSTVLARAGRWPGLMDAVLRGARRRQAAFDDLVDIGLHDGHFTSRLAAGALLTLPNALRRPLPDTRTT